jgi:hypothetical protein
LNTFIIFGWIQKMEERCDIFFHLDPEQVIFLVKYASLYADIQQLMYHFKKKYPESTLLKHYDSDFILCRHCHGKLLEIKYGAFF